MAKLSSIKNVKPSDVTLKNVKHAQFASEETNCFTATVYIQGVRFGYANNSGKGGPTDVTPVDVTNTTMKEFNEECRRIDEELKKFPVPKSDGFNAEMFYDLELAIDEALITFLVERDVKKLLKKVTYIITEGENKGVYSFSASVKPAPEFFEKLRTRKDWSDSNIILNELSFEDAVAAYKKNTGN